MMWALAWRKGRAMLRRVLGLLAVAAIAAVLVGCGGGNGEGGTSEPTGHSLSGQITLHEGGWQRTWGQGDTMPCEGKGGYSDIREGTQVVVKDDTGSVVAVGALGPGDGGWGVSGKGDTDCRLGFNIVGIPDEGFYSIEVSHRGELAYSYNDLEALGWTVAFELGE